MGILDCGIPNEKRQKAEVRSQKAEVGFWNGDFGLGNNEETEFREQE
jgi:hypothetical protein